MGLDIYLYRYKMPVSDALALVDFWEKESEKHSQGIYKEFGVDGWSELTTAQQKEYLARKRAWSEAQHLDEDGEPDVREMVKVKSALHPDHMFEIGYFRSSYNEGGIERILNDRVGRSLEDVFPGDDEARVRVVDWSAALGRAKALRDDFVGHLATHGSFRVIRAEHNHFVPLSELPTHERAALAVFQTHRLRERHPVSSSDYGCRDGDFFLGERGLRVRAIIPGTKSALFGATDQPQPCQYVIVEADDFDWYTKALDVVVESCEWVLAQPDPERFVQHWSG